MGRKRVFDWDRFADLLADGLTVSQAAEHCGASASYGRVLLTKMKKKLGWQAV